MKNGTIVSFTNLSIINSGKDKIFYVVEYLSNNNEIDLFHCPIRLNQEEIDNLSF